MAAAVIGPAEFEIRTTPSGNSSPDDDRDDRTGMTNGLLVHNKGIKTT
jgi:hypothetical protein